MVSEYVERRDALISALSTIEGVRPFTPRGAFYVWAELDPAIYERLGVADANELSDKLAAIGIGSAPGSAFGQTCDDAIRFALEKRARHIVLVPCCQAEVAGVLRRNKGKSLANALTEIYRHPLHTREFGSQITNVLRCLQLEAHGYQVSVTELVGWEHSMKNELIVAQYKDVSRRRPSERLNEILDTFGLDSLRERFFTPA